MAHVTDSINVLIIGDDRFLVDLVVANLQPIAADVVVLGEPANSNFTASGAGLHACLLVILALSQSTQEPVVVLAQTDLTHLVGTIPLLIISDRPFRADLKRRIYHLPFPFHASTLHAVVERLMAVAEAAKSRSAESAVDAGNTC